MTAVLILWKSAQLSVVFQHFAWACSLQTTSGKALDTGRSHNQRAEHIRNDENYESGSWIFGADDYGFNYGLQRALLPRPPTIPRARKTLWQEQT